MSTANLLLGGLFLLTLVSLTSLFLVVRLQLRMRRLFAGAKAKDLESLMGEIVERVKALRDRADDQAEATHILESRLEKQGRGVRLVRFNPFAEVGGNHSFAVAIVNKEGDGVVFSSLYSRDRMSVFAKPIEGGTSDIELTPEEAGVVAQAREDANA